jgi:hypothetical protein
MALLIKLLLVFEKNDHYTWPKIGTKCDRSIDTWLPLWLEKTIESFHS